MNIHRMQPLIIVFVLSAILLSSCLPAAQSITEPQTNAIIPNTNGQAPESSTTNQLHSTQAIDPTKTNNTSTSSKDVPKPLLSLHEEQTPSVQPSQTPLREAPQLDPANWKEWPERPVVSSHLREIYLQGLSEGNDPHAFSVLGDCQSQPPVFMGVFDSEPALVKGLPTALQDTVQQFSGSFNRYSPTVKDGTTEGALLWAQWNDNKEKKCQRGETPLDCELRVHKPSIVFIHIGTHWEARNRHYLTLIIDKVLAKHAVPVLVTKADNREKDERVNQNLASLADEYNLPLWNFWATVQHLPHNGLKTSSDTYLSDEGVEIHRMGALKALDAVWEAVRE